MHKKAKFVCFMYMQPQKRKFKSVQINMKHVSYIIHKDIQTNTRTERQTNTDTHRQADRQTDRQEYIHTYIHTYVRTYIRTYVRAYTQVPYVFPIFKWLTSALFQLRLLISSGAVSW